MTAKAFTTSVLFAAVAGGGWIAGVGVRARTAVREIAEPALSRESTSVRSGIRLGGPSDPDAGASAGLPVLRIFGDYECPACRALDREAGDSLRALADAGLIAVVYHHRPLSTHPRGVLAAEVAYCGAAAGGAAAAHEALGENVERWAGAAEPLEVMVDAVAAPGPVRGALESCVAGGRMAESVDADRRLADALAVTAVPAVFLDSARLEFRSYTALLSYVTRRAAGRRIVRRESSAPPRGRARHDGLHDRMHERSTAGS